MPIEYEPWRATREELAQLTAPPPEGTTDPEHRQVMDAIIAEGRRLIGRTTLPSSNFDLRPRKRQK